MAVAIIYLESPETNKMCLYVVLFYIKFFFKNVCDEGLKYFETVQLFSSVTLASKGE